MSYEIRSIEQCAGVVTPAARLRHGELRVKRLLFLVFVGFVSCNSPWLWGAEATEQSPVLARIQADVSYLASDALQGRGILTAGNRKTTHYIRTSFREDGLVGGLPDGNYFQAFPVSLGADLNADQSHLRIVMDHGAVDWALGAAYQPLAAGAEGDVRAELVFAGYGITAPKEGYDDYANIDVKGKVVLVLRKEPGQGDPDGAFEGPKITAHAVIRTKLQTAQKAGAAALLLVNDAGTIAESKDGQDHLARFEAFGDDLGTIPFAQVSREAVNRLLSKSPLKTAAGAFSSLTAIETKINKTLKPVTGTIDGVSVDLAFSFDEKSVEVANVVGVVPGRRSDEYVVVGAHLDHIGYGAVGSRTPGVHEIHNGADDNASGTAALLELARRTASGPQPKRTVVFIAFNAEERGLLGSKYYLAHPLFPLEKTVAMLNLDMVGRWDDNPMTVYGAGTAEEWDAIFAPILARQGDDLQPADETIAVSDHYGFYQHDIPALHFFTGLTAEYHTPADDVETIDVPGIARAVRVTEAVLQGVLNQPDDMEFAKVKVVRPSRSEMSFLGVVPAEREEDKGVRIREVIPSSPAAKAGFKMGDVITQIGDIEISDLEDLYKGLRTYEAGETVDVAVRRTDKAVILPVTLGELKD